MPHLDYVYHAGLAANCAPLLAGVPAAAGNRAPNLASLAGLAGGALPGIGGMGGAAWARSAHWPAACLTPGRP